MLWLSINKAATPVIITLSVRLTTRAILNDHLIKFLPIYKADDGKQISNYKPTSILPYFSKIYEKDIFIR